MSAVDSLPGDQRAVLQLVLGRRRSYEDIARLLSINPSAVRERALTALDSLGPQTRIDQSTRAQICDYLLGQLAEGDVEAVRERLAGSAGERAWARVLSSELAPLSSEPLPEIPLEASAGRAAPPTPAGEPDPPASEPATSTAQDAAADGDTGPGAPTPPGDPSTGPRSSRLGGLVVIGVVVAIVVVGLIVVLGSGSSKKKSDTIASTPSTAASTAAASATTPAATPTTSATTTTSTSTAAKVVAQINLTPSAAGSKTAGIAEILREGTTNGIAIVAQNVPPNTTKPPNAYAVWLYNSPTDAKILGFVNPGVPKSGKLSTAGGLPPNAAHYKELIVTAETSANPKAPGPVILQGTLTGV